MKTSKKILLPIIIIIVVLSLISLTVFIRNRDTGSHNNTGIRSTVDDSRLEQINVEEDYQSLFNSLPSGWEMYDSDKGLGEFRRIDKGLYEFDKESKCNLDEWKDHEGCTFNYSYMVLVVNMEKKSSIFVTFHEAEDAGADKFISDYQQNFDRNRQKGIKCSGGVLFKNNQFINVAVSEGEADTNIYNIYENIKQQTGFDALTRCDQ